MYRHIFTGEFIKICHQHCGQKSHEQHPQHHDNNIESGHPCTTPVMCLSRSSPSLLIFCSILASPSCSRARIELRCYDCGSDHGPRESSPCRSTDFSIIQL